MPRYINAESLINIFNTKAEMALGTPKQVFFSAANMVEKLPAADVAEVKHGRWELHGNDDSLGCSYFCSRCGWSIDEEIFYPNSYDDEEPYNFCPHCGAKMDGGDGE